MVQLTALAVNPPTFDPVRATLAGASLFGQQVQSATALENLRTAPERHALAVEHARRQNALASLQVDAAQRDQGALSAFQAQGGIGNPSALRALYGNPQLFAGALQGYTAHATWRNGQNAQAAQRVLMAGPEGSESRAQTWSRELQEALDQQRIDQNTFAQLSAQQPSDAVLQRLIDMARAPGAEPTMQEIMRTGMPGAPHPGQPRDQSGMDSLGPLRFQMRDDMGLTPPPDVQDRAAEIARLQATLADAAPTVPGAPVAPVAPPVPPQTFSSPVPPGFYGRQSQRPDASAVTPPPGAPAPGAPQPGQRQPGQPGSRERPHHPATAWGMEAAAGRVAVGDYVGGENGLMRITGFGSDGQPTLAPADDPTRVYGWPGDPGAETVPVSGPPSAPGVTFGQPGDGVGTTGPNLLGGDPGGPPRPPTGPQTFGDAVHRILGATGVTDAQRVRFWTLMSRASTRDDAMKLLQEIESGGVPLTATQRIEREAGLRDEFRALARPYLDMGDSLARIDASLPTGEGDLSLIYNFMRMLDPGSVVREGEFAMLGRSGGLPQQVQQYFNRLSGHGVLTPQMRDAVKAQSRALMQAQEQRHLGIQQQYGALARRLGLSPENVMIDFTGQAGQPSLTAEQQSLLTEARQAIAAGRDAAAVRARLQQRGVDPALLDSR